MEDLSYTLNIEVGSDVEQYQLVVEQGDGTFDITADSEEGDDGEQLALVNSDAGEDEEVGGKVLGVAKAIAGGEIDRFADIMPAAGGKVLTAAGAGNVVFARALDAAAADGDIIRVALRTPGNYDVLA